MINLEAALSARDSSVTSSSLNNQVPAVSSEAFETALSAAITQVLSSFGVAPGSVQFTVDDPTSPASGDVAASQNSVAAENPASAPVSSLAVFGPSSTATPASEPVADSPAAVAAPVAVAPETTEPVSTPAASLASTPVSSLAVFGPAAVAVPVATAPATAVTAAAPVSTPQSVDDAYWAKQPAAVQQLRNIQDPGTRAVLGSQLASEGYTIDVPIMVWGWDAGITTQLRQSYGYTWVPSALQQNIAEAPGIYSGVTPYDPAHPPAGSISVSG